MMMRMKLNLGCGKDYIDDWVNVDFYDDSKCDVTHDLEEFPWPWSVKYFCYKYNKRNELQ